jgi:ABC-type branched-subunit amino acid transport system substrate-binding protein
LKTKNKIAFFTYSHEMRKVRNIALGALIGIGGLYLVSIGNAKPLAPGLRVGVLVSDSGELGFAGSIQRAAARLAVSDLVEEKTQVKVELNFVDVGNSASEYSRAFAKLRALRSEVILAPIESDSARALVENTGKSPVPIIAPSSLEDDLGVTNTRPWFFRLATSPSQDSYALSEMIARTKPGSTLIVSSSLESSRDQMRSLAFGLVMRGQPVQTLNIKDIKAIAKTKPEAMVLLSMEESVTFFSSLEDWVSKLPQVYLVPSNLADYSSYPWANTLKGALAISPRAQINPIFKSDLAKALGNQAIVGPRGAAVLALGQRTYDAIKIAAGARIKSKTGEPEELRTAISKALNGGSRVFGKQGFFEQSEYSVFRYGSFGTFTQSSVFSPN